MSERLLLARRSEMPGEGEAREFTVLDKQLCVARINGEICAIENACMHRGGPLGQGVVEGGKVVCPWHGWEFDLKTGRVAHNSLAGQQVYNVTVEGDDVFIEV